MASLADFCTAAYSDEKRLMRLQSALAKLQLLIIDELGYVPLSQTGAELLFEVISQRYERLGWAALRTPPMPYRLLKLAEDCW